jgi:hypothetical protein
MKRCDHKKTKKNFPFGRKSKADKFCKRCGMIITNKMIRDSKSQDRRK